VQKKYIGKERLIGWAQKPERVNLNAKLSRYRVSLGPSGNRRGLDCSENRLFQRADSIVNTERTADTTKARKNTQKTVLPKTLKTQSEKSGEN